MIKKLTISVITILVCFVALNAEAQEADYSDENVICEVVDVYPEYIGGESQLYKDIASRFKYPSGRIGIEGKVSLRYVVEKDGSVTNIEVLKSLNQKMDEASILALKGVFEKNRYSPGLKNGVPVRVRMTLPITFKAAN